MIKRLVQFLIVLVFTAGAWSLPSWGEQARPAPETEIPKNIILFIGDGMGLAHVTAAYITKGGLNLEEFPITGLLRTQALDRFITSSGGTTTAMATGFLTNAQMVAVTPTGKPLKTVLEYAEERGKATGLISTSSITDATPACFASHVRHRRREKRIAEDIASKNIDVIIGGGLEYFLPSSSPQSKRSDDKDLLALLAQTHTIVTNPLEFRKVGRPARLAAFLAMDEMPTADERLISLSEMVQKAIQILSRNENGFFLMAEGSQIDWAGHRGYGETLIQEVVDLDDAVGAALDFAKRRGDTLIVVTADHETGGYVLLNGSVRRKKITKAVFLTDKHSGVMVPLFAYGPGSEVFSGIHPSAFVGQRLIDYVLKGPGFVVRHQQQ